MRKMFSKNQIEKIVNDNEVVSRIVYDPSDESLNISADLYINGQAYFNELLHIEEGAFIASAESIQFTSDDKTLQDKLDEKQGIVSFESENTFGNDLTNHKLYNNNKVGLTAEEVNTLKENMAYWIKKGYFSYETAKYKIANFSYSDSSITMSFYEVTAQDNQGNIELTGYTKVYCYLDISSSEYTYEHEEY